mmetsp:Transcript_22975/g.61606  ORF Transcript_22975/g.61606 Transcript_22975/m.61606 type:complete len:307 (-) Transcript_22975:162-1082(-)|eukprot:1033444-Prymnesium_polylepis.1
MCTCSNLARDATTLTELRGAFLRLLQRPLFASACASLVWRGAVAACPPRSERRGHLGRQGGCLGSGCRALVRRRPRLGGAPVAMAVAVAVVVAVAVAVAVPWLVAVVGAVAVVAVVVVFVGVGELREVLLVVLPPDARLLLLQVVLARLLGLEHVPLLPRHRVPRRDDAHAAQARPLLPRRVVEPRQEEELIGDLERARARHRRLGALSLGGARAVRALLQRRVDQTAEPATRRLARRVAHGLGVVERVPAVEQPLAAAHAAHELHREQARVASRRPTLLSRAAALPLNVPRAAARFLERQWVALE